MLSVVSSWFVKGRGKQFKIPTRWGSDGRVNVLGTLSLSGTREQLEYRILEGQCTREQVVAYLQTLADRCDPAGLTVVVLDNAPFHKGGELAKRREEWEKQGLYLRYLPAYCPFLNLIETTWRKLKGFLMPRRCYNSVAELMEALLSAFKLLGAMQI